MYTFVSAGVEQTESFGERIGRALRGGAVLAMFGGMGMGKTAFVRGLARGMGLCAEVSSPTFALVNDYGGTPTLAHFDMYRIQSWGDLYSTGFFDYLDMGAVLAVEWSENIEEALPDDAVRLTFERLGENERRITVTDPAGVLGEFEE